MNHNIFIGDCRQQLKNIPDNSIDSIVTDPPYELGFMGKTWDSTGVAYDVTVWQECLRVLKPGGHLLAFGGSRTYHRLACAVEDAGFQIRDQIMWVYGSGFPKSLDISKAIDKAAGAEREVLQSKKMTGAFSYNGPHSAFLGKELEAARTNIDITAAATAEAKQWEGWGTALKPAHEPIVLARKPLVSTVANNVLVWGVGGLNIDGCRVAYNGEQPSGWFQETERKNVGFKLTSGTSSKITSVPNEGRFPANFIHDGSDEVLQLFPSIKPDQSAARFFYCAKANKKDRNEGLDGFEEKQTTGGGGLTAELREDGSYETASAGGKYGSVKAKQTNFHPTVKPTDLMRYLCRMITPPNGTVLDPFTGSGSTGKAAILEGFNFVGCELNQEYADIANARINHAKQTS